MKELGYLNLAAGLLIAILTISNVFQTMNGIAFTFIVGAIMTMPAIASYTKIGLNEDGGPHMEESKRRSKLLRTEYPYVLAPLISVAAIYVLIALSLRDHRAFLLFSSFLCLASAYWLIWVFPRASRLFEPLAQYTKCSIKSGDDNSE